MTNYHFISIFIISCILLGIQPSVSAQSSDRVYSPYAQYLTNDTTIPPPVGEPADAALSCFRPDTICRIILFPAGYHLCPRNAIGRIVYMVKTRPADG